MIVKTEQFSEIDQMASSLLTHPDNDRLGDVDDIIHPNSSLLSDDIWKKFELDFPELSNIDDIFKELEGSRQNSLSIDLDECIMRNHDCMWAGNCASKDHPTDTSILQNLNFIIPKPPVLDKRSVCGALNKPSPQQSVLKPTLRNTNLNNNIVIQPSLNTPPESDNEEDKYKPNILQILNEAINEYDVDDSDLTEYFEDKDIKEEPLDSKDTKEDAIVLKKELDDEDDEEDDKDTPLEEMSAYQMRNLKLAAENDHSYHQKDASIVNMNYGLETPSDSEEEEIDVVSVNDKLTLNASARIVNSYLPTNPSSRDRQTLQRRVATAITKKRANNGIKTILPIRKPYETKRKNNMEHRGNNKRGKHCRVVNTIPVKRRLYGNFNSDSETEPSEKRSLHNNMERQRRIDLRNAFEDLRVLVPEVAKKDRAAKVVILKEAAQYCEHLTNMSHNYYRHFEELKRRQEWLRQRVSQLRRTVASKR